jgi:chromosome segregation ATPase
MIRKFTEATEQLQLSNETLEEMMNKITQISEDMDSGKKTVSSIVETLSNFLSNSKSSNNQIDDAHLNLKTIETKISDMLGLLDQVNNQLKDYNDSGEKFIY